MDPAVLQEVIDDENAECENLEAQIISMQLQEEQSKKKRIIEQLDSLQAIKEKKELYKRVLAGELPASAVKIKRTPASNPVTPVTSPTRPTKQAPKSANSEYNNLLSSVLQLRHGNLAPFANLMSQRSDVMFKQDELAVNLDKQEVSKVNVPKSVRNLNFKSG